MKKILLFGALALCSSFMLTACGGEDVFNYGKDKSIIMGLKKDVKTINIPKGTKEIYKLAFTMNDKIQKVVLNDELEIIGQQAFSECTSLKEIVFSNSLTEIGSGAFGGCDSLKTLTINGNNLTVGSGAFANCEGLEKVTINKKVKSLKSDVFMGCSNLDYVDIKSEDVTISADAFWGCRVTNLVLPKGLESINRSSFEDCNLYHVFYNGTEEEFENVNAIGFEKGSIYYDSVCFYSETKPTTDGRFWHYDASNEAAMW